METYNGHKPVEVFGILMRVNGNQVYYHKGRDELSVEHDNRYLVNASECERLAINSMLAMEAEKEDGAFAEECERDKKASLAHTELW